MNKVFHIAFIILGFGHVGAQNQSLDVYSVTDTTVVTASRYARPTGQVSENITVLTQSDLENAPVRNLVEALNFTPGLAVRKTGGFATRELFSIQGSEPRHVTLLVDGIPMNNVIAGLADPVQFSAAQFHRVEVVKGPASNIWGSALGGVVQVISPSLDHEGAVDWAGDLSLGKWGTRQENVSLRGSAGAVGYWLTAGHATTDGFQPRSAHDGLQLYGRAETRRGESRWGVSYGYNDGDTEDFVQFGSPLWKEHEYTTKYGQVYYKGKVRGSWSGHAQLFGVTRDEVVRFRGLEDGQTLSAFDLDEPTWGGSAQLVGSYSKYGRVFGGVDLRRTRAGFAFIGGPEDKAFDQLGGYANWHRLWGRLVLDAGWRWDRHSLYGTQWSPAAGMVYDLGFRTLVRARVARGFGAPTLDAAFLPETETTAPNPDLEAEFVTSTNLGVETRYLSPLWLRVTWYNNSVENAIDTAQNDEGKFFQRNFAEQERRGLEVEGRLALLAGVEISGGLTFNDVKSKDQDEIINGTARRTRDLVVQYGHRRWGTKLWLGGHYAEYDIADRLKAPPLNFSARDGRFLWDFKLRQPLPGFAGVRSSLFVSGYNLLDTQFWWLTPFPLPGRSFEVGIRIRRWDG